MSAVVEISILIVAISILVVSLLGSISFILLSKNISEFLKKKNKIDELNLYDQVYNSRESIEMMLDEFIGKQFDEYTIFNPDIFQSEYLSSNDLEKIVTELRRKVLSNISISLLNELSLIFNKEQLYTIITTKIQMVVINEGVNHNAETPTNDLFGFGVEEKDIIISYIFYIFSFQF